MSARKKGSTKPNQSNSSRKNSQEVVLKQISSTGIHSRLASLMKNDLKSFVFDLPDPCHGFNLVLQKSLDKLPKRFLNFVKKIQTYFRSLQKKSGLRKIQKVGVRELVIVLVDQNLMV